MTTRDAIATSMLNEQDPALLKLVPTDLRVDGSAGPTLGARAHPVLSWDARESSVGHTVEISSPDGVVWSRETARGARTIRSEARLKPFTAYQWRVRALNGSWAEADFETGPLELEDWSSTWLAGSVDWSPVAQFHAAAEAVGRLYIAVQGLARVVVNGQPVAADELIGTRGARRRALFRAIDITPYLREGANEMVVHLGRGWWAATGQDPRFLLQIDLREGSSRRVVVPQFRECIRSPIATQRPFYLERLEDPTGLEDGTREACVRSVPSDEIAALVQPDSTPALRVVETRQMIEVGRSADVRIFDLGDNVAGRTRVTVTGQLDPGTLITVVHGEHLDSRGRVDTTNLTMPFDHGRTRQVFEWVPQGMVGERGEPWFAYYGFRYAEVRGLPSDAQIALEARVLHSAVEDVLDLTTDSPVILHLGRVARRTALNNLHGVPEDCPTREQAAWTGDMASAAEWEFAAFDHRALMAKWLTDLADSQAPTGAIPAVAPNLAHQQFPPDPVWGSALPRVMINHWLQYGDASVITAALPALRAWSGYILSKVGARGIVDGFDLSYGHDWLALEQTPPELLHTAAAIDTLEILARLEEETGGDGEPPRRRADALRNAAIAAFVDPTDNSVANGSQGSLAMAISARLLNQGQVEQALAHLESDIRRRGTRISTGFAATRTLVEVLAYGGRGHLISDLLHQPDEPGIGAMLASGPGTFWENWWIDPTNTGTGSLDHVGLGAPFAAWAVYGCAGVSSIGPGWSRVRFAPNPVASTDELRVHLSTVRGKVAGGWKRDGGALFCSLSVPAGAEAEVSLPDGTSELVGPGVYEWSCEDSTQPSVRAEVTPPWQTPAIHPVAADVDRPSLPAIAASVRAAEGDPTIDVVSRLECMPIPHAQFHEAVALVRASSDKAPTVRVALEHPMPLEAIRFVYAHLDVCLDTTARAVEPVLHVQLEDGETLTGVGRFWPAGWNRVALDISEGETRRAVTIEVGLRFAGGVIDDVVGAFAADLSVPAAFHLGSAGFSGHRRLW